MEKTTLAVTIASGILVIIVTIICLAMKKSHQHEIIGHVGHLGKYMI